MIGRKIAQYEVLAKLGEGGMGEVYRARDTRLDREVALKVLPPAFAKDPERLARFRREAKLLASLQHTHIAALHGLEEVGSEVFLAMELVEGEDLSVRLARGPLDLDDALELARQFAEGLEAAHEQNIVHRDLKPANLKLTSTGQLKILDFGLARAYLGDGGDGEDMEQSPTITAALTAQGVILGTAAYMSPEQARGRRIDQRTDIWAFGAILFEMLSGQRVFTGETISDTMAAVLRADPPWEALPADLPSGVRHLIERCLERDARRRLRDIGEARVRLERWRDDPASADETAFGTMSGPTPMARDRRAISSWLPWGLVATAVLIMGILGWRLGSRPMASPQLMEFKIRLDDDDLLAPTGGVLSISPDGNWIAWQTATGLYLRAINSQEARLIDGSTGGFTSGFSPDSQWLAFAGGGDLRRVSVRGGSPISICSLPTPRGLAWIDETTIVFPRTISDGLQQIDLRDGSMTTLTELDVGINERSHRWPTVVPGRRAVLYECQFLGQDYDRSDIRIVDLDTGISKVVQRGGAAPQATAQGQLLFVREHTLFGVRFDSKSGETLGLPVPVREDIVSSVGNQENDDGSAQFRVDERGTLFYVDSGGAGNPLRRMVWVDLESDESTPIGEAGRFGQLRLSPDGKKVVVSRERAGDVNLYVINLETGHETMITNRVSVEYVGAWSPDSKVFYWSQATDTGNKFEVWRRPIDGTSPPEFVIMSPTDAGLWPNDVSPDGRFLACAVWMGANLQDIMILDLDDIDAGFINFDPSPKDHNMLRWVGPNFVVYREGGIAAGQLMIRRFPDDGALWTIPETGYLSAQANFSLDAIVATGPKGAYRFSLSTSGDRIQIGQREILRIWTSEEARRLLGGAIHPDGKRAIGLYSEDPEGARGRQTVGIVTGWAQSIQKKLE